MKPIILIISLFNSLFPLQLSAVTPAEFKYGGEIRGPIEKKQLYRVHLPREILAQCAKACRDLRLFDPKGTEIPYVLYPNVIPGKGPKSYPFEIVTYQGDEKSRAILTMKLSKTLTINLIRLDIPDRDFKKQLVLKGSHDAKTWEDMTRGVLYDYTSQIDLRKKEIRFKPAQYLYYQIELSDMDAESVKPEALRFKYGKLDFTVNTKKNQKVRINKVVGVLDEKSDTATVYDEAEITPRAARLDPDKNSLISMAVQLPVDRMFFTILNPYFYRAVEVRVSETGQENTFYSKARGNLYHFPLSDLADSKNYLDLHLAHAPFLELKIINHENPPLTIEKIRVSFKQQILIFMGMTDVSHYTVSVGHAIASSPNYDLTNFIRSDNWFAQKYVEAKITNWGENSGYKAPVLPVPPKDKSYEQRLLIGIVILLTILMAVWLYTLKKKAINPPAQK